MDKSILDHFVVIPEALQVQPAREPEDNVFLVADEVKPLIKWNPEQRITFPLFFDNSMLEAYSLCQYKGHARFGRNLAPSGINQHLHFGGAMAKGLEVTRRAYYGDKLSAEEAIERGLIALWMTFGDYINPDPRSSKTVDRLQAAFVAYFEEYPLDKDFLQPYMSNGKPAVEFTFAVPLPDTRHPETGEPILYVGKFDMLATYRGAADLHHLLFVDDEKTLTSSGPTWREKWDLDPQMSGYVWGSRTFGYPVGGAMVRGIVILKGEIRFEQKLTQRSEWQLDQWLDVTREKIDRIIFSWRRNKYGQALNSVCSMYGGCDFRKLCTAQNPEKWIAGNYTTRVWNPLSKED